MAEQYANNPTPAATLGSGINNSVTSLSISSATGFPASGTFRIRIDDEIIIVGAISGTTLSTLTRGAEGTTGASHSSGAAVNIVLTASGVLKRSGVYVTAGGEYFAGPVLGKVTLPAPQLTTWINQDSSTVSSVAPGSLHFVFNSANLTGFFTGSYPATPYTLTVLMSTPTTPATNYSAGLAVTDGTKITMLFVGTGGTPLLRVLNFNSFSSFNATAYQETWVAAPLVYLQLNDDGTNFTFSYSTDGVNFRQVFQVGRGSFLSTPTALGVIAAISTATGLELIGFDIA